MNPDTADDLQSELKGVEQSLLTSRLAALARRGETDGADWGAIQDELARRRLETMPQPVPLPPSLRAQIIEHLRVGPDSTPSQIAAVLTRSTTVVSRVLGVLLNAGLVEYAGDQNDGRIRRYRLTGLAVDQAGGATPPEPTEKERQYLALTIGAAVRARRRTNDLAYASDRLERVLEQASKLGADDLALVARRELLTTLRQAGKHDQVEFHLLALRDIERGAISFERHLIAPASGCLYYEMGRLEDLPPRERLDHLVAAASIFRRCESMDEGHDWSPREGWALLASAELWRKQTEFGVALAHARRATAVFEAYDDTYGAAEATRLQGFCQRLRGDFSEAATTLKRAESLAEQGSAERCLADVLLQLGDTHRCAGALSLADGYLRKASAIARQLDRPRTLGFSLTALAAVAFAEGAFDAAWSTAAEAEPYLQSSPSGKALNTRRQAVIARELAHGGDSAMQDTCTRLFEASLDQYRNLGSPAGVAACLIGIGRQAVGKPEVDAAITALINVASTGSGRLLLPMDPWIPGLARQWADESEFPEVRRVADWTYRSDDARPSKANEMAGEPRMKSSALAL